MFNLSPLRKPYSIQANFTDRCNLRCVHCDIWKKEKGPELSSRQWRDIILELKKWLGPYRLDVSGGEPFVRQDTVEIIEFCGKNQVKPVVTTNATLLGKETIARLAQIGDLTLNISLDAAAAAAHDYLRGTKGVHEKVMEVLKEFKAQRKKCHLTIATILMGYNAPGIAGILELVSAGRLADGINFQALDNNFDAAADMHWQGTNALWPRAEKKELLLRLIDELMDAKKAGAPVYNSLGQLGSFKDYFAQGTRSKEIVCASGESNFIITAAGKVRLCWNMGPIGDCLTEQPDAIWYSALAGKRRKEIRDCARTCRILNCNFDQKQ